MSSSQWEEVFHKSEGCPDNAHALSLFTAIDLRCQRIVIRQRAFLKADLAVFHQREGDPGTPSCSGRRERPRGRKKIQKRIHPLHFPLPLLSPAGSWKRCDGLKQRLPLVTHPCGMLAQTGSLLYSSQLTTKNGGLKCMSVCWFQNGG